MSRVAATVGRIAPPDASLGATATTPRWRSLYSRYGALFGYSLAAASIYLGWLGRAERNITAEHGLGYALGIIGGLLMLLLLLYSLRKRVRALQRLGATSHWFRGHMILGIVGPVLILYHCNFQLGDLNSEIALYCTLLVAGSGIVGRYLYAGIHQGLYGRKATLQDLVASLEAAPGGGHLSSVMRSISAELAELDREVLAPPQSLSAGLLLPLRMSWRTRRSQAHLVSLVRRDMTARSAASPVIRQHADRLLAGVRRYVAAHLAQVRKVARYHSFERLFALWHIVHVPFFFMMIAAALFHVFAVHFF